MIDDGKGKYGFYYDGQGGRYPSFSEMCRCFGKTRSCVLHRLNAGWTLHDALTVPVGTHRNDFVYKDPATGTVLRGYRALTQYYHISFNSLKKLMQERGFSIERAITYCVKHRRQTVQDHTGQEFKSYTAMAKAWHINFNTLMGRIYAGMSIQRALTAKIAKPNERRKKNG